MGAKGRLRLVQNGFSAFCSGCNEYHFIDNSTWSFDGNFEKPTFSPSLLTESSDRRCHAYITSGEWRYLSDSNHSLKDQKIPLRNEELLETDCP